MKSTGINLLFLAITAKCCVAVINYSDRTSFPDEDLWNEPTVKIEVTKIYFPDEITRMENRDYAARRADRLDQKNSKPLNDGKIYFPDEWESIKSNRQNKVTPVDEEIPTETDIDFGIRSIFKAPKRRRRLRKL